MKASKETLPMTFQLGARVYNKAKSGNTHVRTGHNEHKGALLGISLHNCRFCGLCMFESRYIATSSH